MRYINPGHPAGALHPQESGFFRGAGGYAQSRDDMSVVIRKRYSGDDPVSQRALMAHGGHFGQSISGTRGDPARVSERATELVTGEGSVW